MSIKILAVDDNSEALFALTELLKRRGYSVVDANSGEAALAALEREEIDLILLDINMPGIDGYEVTKKVKANPQFKFIPLVLLTSNSDLESLLKGLAEGADNYITKPYKSEELIARIEAMIRLRETYSQLKKSLDDNSELRAALRERSNYANIIGKGEGMQQIFSLIERVKDADVPVLITGESGTGKELIARALHFMSVRSDKPFVVQNCSALNENLLESELFGHVRGAFTGAVRDKQGLFEVADGGTFFLDELGEMSPALQVKLLRVLQDGTFTPVGGTQTKKVSVRVVAATNRDLQKMMKEGTFREDLFYRLNVIALRPPPLRDRREDIPLLCEYFLEQRAKKSATKRKKLSTEVLKLLCDYRWPGNIRELENEIERISVLSGEATEITKELLSPHVLARSSDPTAHGSMTHAHPQSVTNVEFTTGELKEVLATVEKELIEKALKQFDGNKSKAAAALGISRTNLIKKVQEYEGG